MSWTPIHPRFYTTNTYLPDKFGQAFRFDVGGPLEFPFEGLHIVTKLNINIGINVDLYGDFRDRWSWNVLHDHVRDEKKRSIDCELI